MPISVPFTGGCACGAIRYECSAEPVIALNCHCRNCQRASGSAFASNLAVPKATLQLSGEVKYYEVQSDSGHTVGHGFCPACGSPVVAKASGLPELAIVKAGSLDDPSWHQPKMNIFTASAQPWDCMNPELPKFEKGPTE